MPYMPSPAIPPGMDPKAWKTIIDAIASEAADLAVAMQSGKPIGKGQAAKVRALRAQAQVFRDIFGYAGVADSDLVALWATQGITNPLRKTADAVRDALPRHALDAAAELERFAAANGMKVVANPEALHATAARATQAITHDWERLAADTQQRIRQGVARGMVGGKNPREVARQVKGAITEAGGMTYARAMTIAQTEMGDLYDSARSQVMTANDDVFGGWWWRARKDACAICQIKHGMIHDTAEPSQRHHNCRCIMVPIVGEPPGPPGSYMPGEKRSTAQVLSGMSPSQQAKVKARDDWPETDPRDLLTLRDNKGWRPSLALDAQGKGGVPRLKQPEPKPKPEVGKPEPRPEIAQVFDAPSDVLEVAREGDRVRVKFEDGYDATYRISDKGALQVRGGSGRWENLTLKQGSPIYDTVKHAQGGGQVKVKGLPKAEPPKVVRPVSGLPGVEVRGARTPLMEQQIKDLESLDPRILPLLESKKIKTVVVDGTVTDVLPHLKGVRPRGWPEGKTWDIVPGAYDPSSRTLIVGRGGHGSESLALHEGGHAVDHALGYPSTAKAFTDAHFAASTAFRSTYFTQAGRAGWSESFAELFSLSPLSPAERQAAFKRIAKPGRTKDVEALYTVLMDLVERGLT